MMIEEVKKLEGQEMSFLELDNRMIELGYFSVFGSGAEHDIHEDKNIVSTSRDTMACEVQIFFMITHDHGEDENETTFILKIIKVDKF